MSDPARHAVYNRWHQLDHRPGNLALPGVVHGERWVRSPDCAGRSVVSDERLSGTHSVNLDWFKDPTDHAIA